MTLFIGIPFWVAAEDGNPMNPMFIPMFIPGGGGCPPPGACPRLGPGCNGRFGLGIIDADGTALCAAKAAVPGWMGMVIAFAVFGVKEFGVGFGLAVGWLLGMLGRRARPDPRACCCWDGGGGSGGCGWPAAAGGGRAVACDERCDIGW
jgi:hypothetical protein